MPSPRDLLRRFLEILTAFVFIPVVGEIFIDQAKKLGLYEHPSELVESIMNWLLRIASNPTYHLIAAFITGLMMGTWIDNLLKTGWRPKVKTPPPRHPFSPDRSDFSNETIFLPDLLKEGPLLSGKNFNRCLLKGPVFFKLQHGVKLLFCTVAEETKYVFLTLPVGSSIIGSAILVDDTFTVITHAPFG
jgi:hypothetical protein